jgi:amyloid beta precursor protein binding protein 1
VPSSRRAFSSYPDLPLPHPYSKTLFSQVSATSPSLDPEKVTPEDAGNNFFLEGPSSIGKSRAEEAVRLLGELNDGVEGKADVRSLEEVLTNDKEWLSDFTIVIAHNLEAVLLDQLASFLWEDSSNPPLVIVRSAGFLAEVYIQYHEHAGMYVVCSISRV